MSDLIDRQVAIDAFYKYPNVNWTTLDVMKKINAVPSAQREIKQQAINSNDCIDRRAALDALRKMQTYKLFSGDDMLLIDQAGAQTELMLLPSAQLATDTNVGTKLGTNLAEVGTDRAEKGFPIDADDLMLRVEEKYGFRSRDRLYDIIRKMPKYELAPAEPKRGEWIEDKYGITICSECRKPRRDNRIDHIGWCNGCGAKMEVTE